MNKLVKTIQICLMLIIIGLTIASASAEQINFTATNRPQNTTINVFNVTLTEINNPSWIKVYADNANIANIESGTNVDVTDNGDGSYTIVSTQGNTTRYLANDFSAMMTYYNKIGEFTNISKVTTNVVDLTNYTLYYYDYTQATTNAAGSNSIYHYTPGRTSIYMYYNAHMQCWSSSTGSNTVTGMGTSRSCSGGSMQQVDNIDNEAEVASRSNIYATISGAGSGGCSSGSRYYRLRGYALINGTINMSDQVIASYGDDDTCGNSTNHTLLDYNTSYTTITDYGTVSEYVQLEPETLTTTTGSILYNLTYNRKENHKQ